RMRGKGSVLGFVLIAGFFPPLAMVGPLFLAYRHISLLNSYPALVITYLIYTVPLATWFLANFFSQLPRQLEEAAVVDGAGRLQAVWRIFLPVPIPGIFTLAVLGFLLSPDGFALAVYVLSPPGQARAPAA